MVAAPLLKICGLRDPAQAAAVAALGADAIGVIGVSKSPRHVQPRWRPDLFAAVAKTRSECLRVLVVADPSDDDLADLNPAVGGHNVLQLHGSESVQRCLQLRERLPAGLQLWKALRIRSAGDLDQAKAFGSVTDALLLDAWVDDQLGGTGQRIPLEWLRNFPCEQPWWLAGGITAARIAEIRSSLLPSGLDASSGVEDRPGIKNLERVAALIEAVKSEPWAGIPAH